MSKHQVTTIPLSFRTTPPIRPRSTRGRGCAGCLTPLIFLGLIAFIFKIGFDSLDAPWAYPWLGPTLTGDWSGAVTTPNGLSGPLTLTLTHPLPDRRHAGSRVLRGSATVDLRPKGPLLAYTLDGYVGKDGHHFSIQFKNKQAAQAGFTISSIEGNWTGAPPTVTVQWAQVRIDPHLGPQRLTNTAWKNTSVALHRTSGAAGK